jgi:hypothetical protein
MQTDPVDDRTLIDGTGSLVTYLVVSGTVEAYNFKGDGSQLTGITSTLPTGLVSSSAQLGLSTTDSPTFSGLTIRGTLTAEQYVVSSSVLYVTQSFSSGSTLFGNSADDTHRFTGSVFIQGPLTVTGGITGSLFGTSSWSTYSVTSSIASTASYIDPLFISASVAAQGLAGTTEWNAITNKPINLISGSGQRSILGLGETDSPTFANGNFTGNVVVGGTLTARTYIISSSIVNYETLRVSGSSKFGDSLDDIHQFTGSLNITGSLIVNGVDFSMGGGSGTSGTAGTSGTSGESGSSGTSGISGSSGTSGASGSSGTSGISGSSGTSGESGSSGTSGSSGQAGSSGSSGSSGQAGSSGSSGQSGSSGSSGSSGQAGSSGSSGSSGQSGSSGTSGTGFNTVSNPADNRLLTSDGTTNSANAESNLTFDGSTLTVTGDAVVTGKLTAQEFHTEFVSASILYESGSTKFGDSTDDTHQFTGSISVSGSSISLNGSNLITSAVTASLSVLSSSYAATSSITYVTNSNFSLSEIEVADFDNNVAVTFVGGRLKFIFGTPTQPSALSLSPSGFVTNRFNLENDNYDVNGSWNNGGYSIVSASLFTGSVLITSVTSGTSLTSNLTTSGSQAYRLTYTASSPLDGTLYFGSTTTTGTLSKTNPTSPVQTETATVQLGATSNQIEQGATGSILISSVTSSANSWTITGFSGTGSYTSTLIPLFGNSNGSLGTATVFVTGSTTGSNSIIISTTASYNSGVLNSPVITANVFDTITYSKIRSLRYGASTSASFTAAELEKIDTWDTTLGGAVGTISKGTTNPSGQSLTITWTGDKFHYIVYDSSRSNLTNITTAGFGVLSSFTLTTVGSYKVYKSNTLQAGGAGTSITYVLT